MYLFREELTEIAFKVCPQIGPEQYRLFWTGRYCCAAIGGPRGDSKAAFIFDSNCALCPNPFSSRSLIKYLDMKQDPSAWSWHKRRLPHHQMKHWTRYRSYWSPGTEKREGREKGTAGRPQTPYEVITSTPHSRFYSLTSNSPENEGILSPAFSSALRGPQKSSSHQGGTSAECD